MLATAKASPLRGNDPVWTNAWYMALLLDATQPAFREADAPAAVPAPQPSSEGDCTRAVKGTPHRGSGSTGWTTTAEGRRHLAELGAWGGTAGDAEEELDGPQ